MDELKEIQPQYHKTDLPTRPNAFNLEGAPYQAPTAAVSGTLSSGGTGMTGTDFLVLTAAVSRINTVVDALTKLGILR